jgi:hypothetical protein
VQLDGREDFERTAEAIKNHTRDAALLQGGSLQQERLRFMDDHVLSAGEYQFTGGVTTGKTYYPNDISMFSNAAYYFSNNPSTNSGSHNDLEFQ